MKFVVYFMTHYTSACNVKSMFKCPYIEFMKQKRNTERRRKKDNGHVAIDVNYGVASFSSWSKVVCNLIWALR